MRMIIPHILLLIILMILSKSLEETSTALFQWFDNNLLKSNHDKCHLLINSNENVTVHVDEYGLKIVSVRNYLALNQTGG